MATKKSKAINGFSPFSFVVNIPDPQQWNQVRYPESLLRSKKSSSVQV